MVHLAIMEAYDADPGDEDEHGPRFFFAADSRVRRFNADIEAWLRHMHSVVPIVAVVRTPDGEAGGTWPISHAGRPPPADPAWVASVHGGAGWPEGRL